MEFSATYYIFTAAQLLLGGSESILHHLPWQCWHFYSVWVIAFFMFLGTILVDCNSNWGPWRDVKSCITLEFSKMNNFFLIAFTVPIPWIENHQNLVLCLILQLLPEYVA
jgi:hypothetical protein